MDNPFLKMSQAEREAQLKMLQKAMLADETRKLVAAAAAFKWAYFILRDAGKLHDTLLGLPSQALPREGQIAKMADLSETQVANIVQSVDKALENSVRGTT